MIRKLVGLFTVSALVAATTYGCSSDPAVTPVDGGTSDAKTDAKADGSGGGGGGDGSTGDGGDGSTGNETGPTNTSTCKPGDVSGFKAGDGGYKPALSVKVCDAAQLDALEKFFAGGRTDAALYETVFGTTAAPSDCGKCIQTKSSDASWGPIVVGVGLNTGGCIERKDGTPGGKECGAAIVDYNACIAQACDSSPTGNCALPEDENDPDYDTKYETASKELTACRQAAQTKCPKALVDNINAKCAAVIPDSPEAGSTAAGTIAVCLGNDNETEAQFWTRFKSIAALFCGK